MVSVEGLKTHIGNRRARAGTQAQAQAQTQTQTHTHVHRSKQVGLCTLQTHT